MIARFFSGAKKHGIYSVLATFGENKVSKLGSWLGWAPGGLPGAILEASGALLDRFWEAFLMCFGDFGMFFCMFFCMPCLKYFQADFSKGSSWNLFFFRSVRKRPTSEICNTLRVKTNILQGARLRRRSGEGEETTQKNNIKTTSKIQRKMLIFLFFRAGRPCSKNAPKMTSRRLSGTLPGSLREGKNAPLFCPRPP